MFNLHDTLTVLRYWALSILLLVPATSHAMAAADDHVLLRDHQVEDVQVEGHRPDGAGRLTAIAHTSRVLGGGAACSSLAPLSSDDCIRSCDDARDDCYRNCGSGWFCSALCGIMHTGCMFSCNTGGPG